MLELSDTVTSEQVSTTAKIANLESLLQETQARVDDLEGKVLPDDVVDRVGKLEQENAQLRDELAIVKGLMQVQEKRILSNKDKITDLTTRSMANNILIAGLVEGTTQEMAKICKDKVLTLLCKKMKMEVKDKEVVVAHRLGKPGLKPCTMVVCCAQGLRDTIFQYMKNLKDVKNEVGDYYYVSVQLPEPLAAEKREREELIKKVKKQNAEIPDQDKHKRKEIVVKNKTVYVDKVPQKTHIFPPTVQGIFNIPLEEQKQMNKLDISHTDPVAEKGSHFRGHAVRVRNSGDIKIAYKILKLLFPESDHIALGYTVKNYSGHQDDAEYSADKRLLEMVQTNGCKDVALFISCEFGGIHLGPRRFLLIEGLRKKL